MRSARTVALATLALLASPSCDHAQDAVSSWRIAPSAEGLTPCVRPPALPAADSIVVEEAPVLCNIVAVPVVQIRPSADASHPDPAPHVVMASDGRYFTKTASSSERQVLVWSADGAFVRAVGRSGEGPGEIDPRGMNHFVGPGDTLYAAGANTRWSVFGPDLEFVRAFTVPARYDPATVHVTERGILTSALAGFVAPVPLAVMDLDGAVRQAFGTRTEELAVRVSGSDGTTLWVLPPNGGRAGVVLEEWTTTGTLVRTLLRPAPWLPLDGYEPRAGEPPLPEFETLHVDPEGLLWYTAAVRDPRWRPLEGRPTEEAMVQQYDGRMEVIDPRSGTVLASIRVDGPGAEEPPLGRFIPGTRRAYRQVEDELGFRTIEVFDLHLVAGGR